MARNVLICSRQVFSPCQGVCCQVHGVHVICGILRRRKQHVCHIKVHGLVCGLIELRQLQACRCAINPIELPGLHVRAIRRGCLILVHCKVLLKKASCCVAAWLVLFVGVVHPAIDNAATITSIMIANNFFITINAPFDKINIKYVRQRLETLSVVFRCSPLWTQKGVVHTGSLVHIILSCFFRLQLSHRS